MRKLYSGLIALIVLSSAFATTAYAGDSAPWADTLYVRGGFNGWGLADPMTWDPAESEYTAIISLDAATWEFKIANETWDNPDFGPLGDPNITFGVASDIGTAIGQNFVLNIVDPGNYLFVLSDISGDLQSGRLLVSRVIPLPAAGVLMLSALGGLGLLRRRRR